MGSARSRREPVRSRRRAGSREEVLAREQTVEGDTGRLQRLAPALHAIHEREARDDLQSLGAAALDGLERASTSGDYVLQHRHAAAVGDGPAALDPLPRAVALRFL